MEKELLQEITQENQNLKYFHILCGFYIAAMILSLTVSARLLPFRIPFIDLTILLTGGTWTIPLSFFIQDITTEVYGYVKSRQLLQLSVIILIAYISYLKLTTFFPIPHQPNVDKAYNIIFNALPRHLFALLTAIVVGNLINNLILSNLKILLKGQYLPLRFITATALGEAVLQLVGTIVAWIGNLKFSSEILPFVIFSYLYKLAFEALMTPLNVTLCRWLKKAEGIDIYDHHIKYNPFSFKSNKEN